MSNIPKMGQLPTPGQAHQAQSQAQYSPIAASCGFSWIFLSDLVDLQILKNAVTKILKLDENRLSQTRTGRNLTPCSRLLMHLAYHCISLQAEHLPLYHETVHEIEILYDSMILFWDVWGFKTSKP